MLTDLLHRAYETENATAERVVAVPAVVEAKLLHLVELADAARAAKKLADERVRDARDEKRDVDAKLAVDRDYWARNPHHRRPVGSGRRPDLSDPATDLSTLPAPAPAFGGGGFVIERSSPDDRSGSVPGLEARLAIVVRALERLLPQAAEAARRSDALGRLAEHCTNYVKTRSPADLEEAVARARHAVAGLTLPRDAARLPAELAKVRDELLTLAAERTTAGTAPVTLAEARERAMAVVDAAASGWEFDVAAFFNASFNQDGAGVMPPPEHLDFRPFIAHMLSERVKEILGPLLEREAARHALLLAPEERAKRLAAVDRKAVAAAVREELIVAALEATGLPVDRREDADPEIVLTTTLDEAA